MIYRTILMLVAPFLMAGIVLTEKPQKLPEYPDGILVFHGSTSGQPTLDSGTSGPGNPFASALIALLDRSSLTLAELGSEIVTLTYEISGRFQTPAVPQEVHDESWGILPKPQSESRIALVLVVSEYETPDGSQSLSDLPGATYDAERVSRALTNAGFETRKIVAPDRRSFLEALSQFQDQTKQADVALLYTTGHGLEASAQIHLMMSDYPAEQGNAALSGHAVRLADMVQAVNAKKLNLVFYAGCRNNPFHD